MRWLLLGKGMWRYMSRKACADFPSLDFTAITPLKVCDSICWKATSPQTNWHSITCSVLPLPLSPCSLRSWHAGSLYNLQIYQVRPCWNNYVWCSLCLEKSAPEYLHDCLLCSHVFVEKLSLINLLTCQFHEPILHITFYF